MRLYRYFAIFSFFASSIAFGGNLNWGNSTWNRAKLVEAGSQKLHLKVQRYSYTDEFNNSGDIQPTGKPYNRKTTFGDLIAEAPDGGANIRSVLKQEDLSLATPAAETKVQLNSTETITEVNFTKGLTSWWMIGVNVPYIQSETVVSAERKLTPEYHRLKNKLEDGGDNAINKTSLKNEPVENLRKDLDENNYDDIRGVVEYSGLGDIELLSQLRVYESQSLYGAFRQRISVPTGENTDPYTYIKSNTADGQMDLGADALLDYQASSRWILTGLLGYTVQVEDTQSSRVPNGAGSDPIEWEIDNDVQRDLGDILIARVNSLHKVLENLWVSLGYEMTNKGEDEFGGTKFDTWRYTSMGENTNQERQIARLGVQYIGGRERRNYFSSRQLAAGFEYFTIFEGKNSPKVDAATVELSFSY